MVKPGSSLKKLGSQTVLYGMGTMLPRFLNYLLTPLLTYIFSEPVQYGIHSELYSYIAFFNVIFTYGLETAFFRFSNSTGDAKKIFRITFSSILLSTFIFSIALYQYVPVIADKLHYSRHPEFIIWCIGIIATDALLALPMARFRLLEKPVPFALMRLGNVMVNILLHVVVFVFVKRAYAENPESSWTSWYNPETGIGYSFLCNLLANVFNLILLVPFLLDYRPLAEWNTYRQILKYSWPLVLVGLAGMVNETFDRIVLKHLLPLEEGMEAQGIYGACYKISIFMTLFVQAFRFAAEPFFFNRANRDDSMKLNAYVLKIFSQFCFLVFLLTSLNLPVLQYFIGEKYRVGIGVVPVLLMANAFLGIYFNLSVWYKISGQTLYGAWISMIGAGITILLNLLLVPYFSYYASAWATFITYFSMCIISWQWGKKHYPAPYNARAIFFYGLFAVVLYLFSYLFDDISSISLKLFLNNLLVIPFVWLWIKWELPVFKKRYAEFKG
ncbi:MAG: oligosaccharide flippase family protein [Bacteroidia bacterium]|nr:oligosaccharide flippase family protein [Bacteroidia bacterium]